MISIQNPPCPIGGCSTEVEPKTEGRRADIVDERTGYYNYEVCTAYVPRFMLEKFTGREIVVGWLMLFKQ